MPSPVSSDARAAPFDLESLARALARADGRLVVWKGGRELAAQGDLDCSAPRAAWTGLARAFDAWVSSQGLTATIACEHALGVLVLVGCGGQAGNRLLQVDLVDVLIVHGAPAWTAEDAAAAGANKGDVPHTLPGAEGLLRRLADGSDRIGPELIALDPAGADLVARRLGLRGKLAAGDGAAWRRFALATVLVARPLVHPRWLARARRSDSDRESCPVLRALRNDRTIEGPRGPWLDEVSASHRVQRFEVAP